MKVAADGMPETGRSARSLGIRTPRDIPAGIAPDVLQVEDAETVDPGTGGLSVAPESPSHLPPMRRPPEFGGRGKDPVWQIDSSELADAGLQYRQDSPTHGLLEPSIPMSLKDFETALERTRDRWQLILSQPEAGA